MNRRDERLSPQLLRSHCLPAAAQCLPLRLGKRRFRSATYDTRRPTLQVRARLMRSSRNSSRDNDCDSALVAVIQISSNRSLGSASNRSFTSS